jgi:hypothetical protein
VRQLGNLKKSNKITVNSDTSLDIEFSSPSSSNKIKFSNVTLPTKNKQKNIRLTREKGKCSY